MKSYSSLCRMSLLAALGLGAPVWVWAQVGPGADQGAPALPDQPAVLVLPGADIPFATSQPDTAANAAAAESLDAGRVELHAGLPTAAGNRFREGLALPGLRADLRDALNLDLVTSYLALGQFDQADAALKEVRDAGAPAAILRAALLAAHTQQASAAATQLGHITPEQLSSEDRPWYYVVQALLAEQDKNADAAQAAWSKAVDLSTVPFQRDEFQAAWWRANTFLGESPTPELANLLTQRMNALQGQTLGVETALHLAVVDDKLGDHAGALKLVTQLQLTMPDDSPEVRDTNDKVRLLLAVLDEEGPASNSDLQRDRTALQKVLQVHGNGSPLSTDQRQAQEIALALLERDPAGLRDFVDKMIADPLEQNNPFLDRLYLLQAQLALDQGLLDQASASATQLKDKFPGSPLREDAFRMLAYIAFKGTPPKYRLAADYLGQLRDDAGTTDSAKRLALSKLIADLDFLNQDYHNATLTYKSVLAALPPGPARGQVLFDAVESELRDGQHDKGGSIAPEHLAAAGAILDDVAAHQTVEPLDRWPAEWNLLSALRDNGQDAQAFDRLKTLLDTGAAGGSLPADLGLRLRLLWLNARLAVDTKDASALKKAEAFQDAIKALSDQDKDENGHPMQSEFEPTALLLLGQAASLNNQPDQEKAYFDDLQKNYRISDAAAFSSMFQAHELVARNTAYPAAELKMKDVYEAQTRDLNEKYAPLAMYEAAEYEIAQLKYDDANDILKTFYTRYPAHELMYQVQMLQAYILDKQNDFKDVRAIYQSLLAKYPDHPLGIQVKMAYATCLATEARISNNAKERQDALDEFESLTHAKDFPPEASAEVYDQYGNWLAQGDEQGKGRDLEAAKAAFLVPVTLFLDNKNPAYAEKLRTSVNGPYWLSRCLFDLANLYEQQQPPDLDEAQRLYTIVTTFNLPFASLAQAHLKKSPMFNPPPTVPESPSPPPAAAADSASVAIPGKSPSN